MSTPQYFNYAVATGHIGNYFDLSTHNTGLLMGVGNTIATIPSYAAPLLCAHVLHAYGDDQGWGVIFNGMATLSMMIAAVYASTVTVDPIDVPGKAKEA